jgi:precorrin-8X/cobalt-precorrin-8 methylmutase
MTPNAVIVIGHGSRSADATKEFLQLVSAVRLRTPGLPVEPAFMELAEPSLPVAVKSLCEQGATHIAVVPCFLFHGNHIKKDIPELIEDLRKAFPATQFSLGRHLGPESRIADLVATRIDEVMSLPKVASDEIERASMRIIEELIGFHNWSELENAVVQRLVHTSGDPTLAASVRMSPGAAEAGKKALEQGAPIVVDVKMVAAGISSSVSKLSKNGVLCAIDDDSVSEMAKREKRTRAECAMERLLAHLNGAVVAIGNAPTALRFVLTLARSGKAKPALIIGMPVGFVDAAESKEELMASNIPYIAIAGPRGGSPMAAATVNALARAITQEAESIP